METREDVDKVKRSVERHVLGAVADIAYLRDGDVATADQLRHDMRVIREIVGLEHKASALYDAYVAGPDTPEAAQETMVAMSDLLILTLFTVAVTPDEQKQQTAANTPRSTRLSVPIQSIRRPDQTNYDDKKWLVTQRLRLNLDNTGHPFHHKTGDGTIVDADPSLELLMSHVAPDEMPPIPAARPDALPAVPVNRRHYGFDIAEN